MFWYVRVFSAEATLGYVIRTRIVIFLYRIQKMYLLIHAGVCQIDISLLRAYKAVRMQSNDVNIQFLTSSCKFQHEYVNYSCSSPLDPSLPRMYTNNTHKPLMMEIFETLVFQHSCISSVEVTWMSAIMVILFYRIQQANYLLNCTTLHKSMIIHCEHIWQ